MKSNQSLLFEEPQAGNTALIAQALALGAKIYGSVSGGKDGQAMVRTLMRNGIPLEGLIHCDLGRAEWPESLGMCQKQADEYNLPLHVLHRADGLDLLSYMRRRMERLAGIGKPFWPSAQARYCTSDLKRLPSNQFFAKTGHNLIISAEGIRAEESKARAKKSPLMVRSNSSSFYKGMTVEEALAAYRPDKRLILTWFPIFNMTVEEVWATYGISVLDLADYRRIYRKRNGYIHWSWPFHPAYAMGNERVSCRFCILGSPNDLGNAAREAPELLEELIQMEDESGFTFRDGFSLKTLLK